LANATKSVGDAAFRYSCVACDITSGFIESFNGRLRDERLNEHVFSNLNEARTIIEDWRIDYNTNRPHSSLNGLTPTEFAAHPDRMWATFPGLWPVSKIILSAVLSTSPAVSKAAQNLDARLPGPCLRRPRT